MTAPPFPAPVIAAARAAAKQHLRIEGSDEDAAIDGYAATALALCEAFTGTAMIAREWTDTLPAAREWRRLAGAPVAAIEDVGGLPAEGEGFALPASNYAIDIDRHGVGWVRVSEAGAAGRVRVTYVAGDAEAWDDIAAPLRQGVVLLIAHLFTTRERDGAPPATVSALWRPYRVLRLARSEHAA